MDWTEQRHHLAGALSAAIADRLFELDWAHRARQHRAVTLTDEGAHALNETLGMQLDADRSPQAVAY